MSEKAPKCYGKYTAGTKCAACTYRLSCEYFTASTPGLDCTMRHCSLDNVSDSCSCLLDPSPYPGEEQPEKAVFSLAEFMQLLRYLLELDEYTFEIVREIIRPRDGRSCTVADLCQLHGVSRQSMHRKILRVISRKPELHDFLRSVLTRNTTPKLA